ncbi:unnamed protein product [Auanema sp. JU1783]|nr:unnamed protein product [Auanema sp. JU1783]
MLTITCVGAETVILMTDGTGAGMEQMILDAYLGDPGQVIVLELTLPCYPYGWGASEPDLRPKDNKFTCDGETECCPANGLWTEWVAENDCSADCGSCAQQVFRRSCLSEPSGCSCTGSDVVIRNCNIDACEYPAPNCCTGFRIVFVNGRFACGPQPSEPTIPADVSCCPPGGFWSLWGEWSGCSGGTCGKCGAATRSRTCYSEEYGCSCDDGEDTETKPCRVLASWNEWVESVSCSESSCGSCSYRVYERTCDSTNSCFCIGSERKAELCNTSPCNGTYCCDDFEMMTLVANGPSFCGPLPDLEPEAVNEDCPLEAECCVMGGIWSEWSAGGSCSSTCGGCGITTRSRYCISEDWNCDCVGEATKSSDCGAIACNTSTPCCSGSDPVSIDNILTCPSLDSKDPAPSDLCWTDCCPQSGGYWSEWFDVGQCSEDCGSCGLLPQKRRCLTEQYGCDCRGNDTRNIVCNTGVCYFPLPTCCEPYVSMVIDDKHSCGPLPSYTTPDKPYDPYCNETCCAETGIWSEWTITPEQCTDYCGSCGNMTKTRTCISENEGCPCQGHSIEISQCNTGVCYYPRLSCCPGYQSMVIAGKHACGPLAIIPEEVPYLNTCGVECCPNAGIWGEWTISVPCNDTCGSCGAQTRIRKCLSTRYGCPCTGDDTRKDVCGTTTCLYPRVACCLPYTKRIDPVTKTIICGPLPTEPAFNPEQTTCCDPEQTGLWNEWKAWSTCSGTCGLCGVQSRNRTCASAAYGCPCVGNTVEQKNCGDQACPSGAKCCAGKYLSKTYDGFEFCTDKQIPYCAGTWTPWYTQTGATCNDTCGMCGVIASYRHCWPSGCQCSGSFTANRPCMEPVCLYPRTACCAGFARKIVGGKLVCVAT